VHDSNLNTFEAKCSAPSGKSLEPGRLALERATLLTLLFCGALTLASSPAPAADSFGGPHGIGGAMPAFGFRPHWPGGMHGSWGRGWSGSGLAHPHAIYSPWQPPRNFGPPPRCCQTGGNERQFYPDPAPYPWPRHRPPVIVEREEPPPPLRPRHRVISAPVESFKPQVGRSVAKVPPKPMAKNSFARPDTGVPAGEHRFVSDEILFELRPDVSPKLAGTIARRERLQLLASQHLELTGTTINRCRIEGARSVAATVAALEADSRIAAVQPNYLYSLQADQAGELSDAQYVIAKMRLTEAHTVSTGANTLVAVIDSGIDRNHPEILGAVKEYSSAPGIDGPPAVHGTAVAGIIAAHAALVGVAPQARMLAFRAFAARDSNGAAHGHDL
jgi:hypothetical protein